MYKNDNRGKSFIAIMVIIAITAFVLRIVIDKVIKISIVQNEANASATLKLISAALENYAKDNHVYPANLDLLTQSRPAYLDKDYIKQSPLLGYIKGYNYNCSRLDTSGYSCLAIPVSCGLTGKKVYSVVTGGLLISDECNKKE